MISAVTTPENPRPNSRWLLEVLLLALVYFATARLGLLLAMPGGQVTAMWPPSGLALAALLLRGRNRCPGIWLGSTAANFLGVYGSSKGIALELSTAAEMGLGATLGALVGLYLLRRFVAGHDLLGRVRDVCAFLVLGGVLSCSISATVGVTTLCLNGFEPWSGYGWTWLTWWMGDTVGVFVFAPMVLIWSSRERETPSGRGWEQAACFGLLVAVTYLIFINNSVRLFAGTPTAFMVMPFLVWSAVRFGRRGAVVAVGLITLLAIWGTIHLTGPFKAVPLQDALLLLAMFLSMVVLMVLCSAAMVLERDRAEAAQQRTVEELESRVQERTAALSGTLEAEQSARQARDHSLSLMTATLESTADGILVVNANGKIETFNRVFARMWRLPDDVLAAKDDALALQGVLDQLQEPQQFLEKVSHLYAHPDDQSFDTLEFKDGRVFERYSQPQRIGGQVVGRVWSFRDVTERRRVKRRLAAFGTVGRRLNTVTDSVAAARIIVGIADELFGWDACKLDLYDVETDLCQSLLTVDIMDGRRQDVAPACEAQPPSPRMIQLMRDGPLLILRQDPLAEAKDIRPFGDVNRPSASIMFVPLMEAGLVVGVLSIQSYRLNAYTREDLTALQDLADHCAGALERLRGRDALRISEARFRAIFEQSPLGIAEGEIASARFVAVNQRFADILGYPIAELRRLTFKDYTHPEDLKTDLDLVNQLAAGEIAKFAIEKRFLRKDGAITWVRLTVSSLAPPGEKPVNCMAVIDDITDRKKAEESLHQTEELYRKVIAGADAVPYDYDYLTRQYHFMGEAIEALTGYPPEEICAPLWQQIIEESIMLGEAAGVSKEVAAQRVLRGEIQQWRSDMRIRTRDGQIRWLSDVSVQKTDASGRVIGSMGTLQDITERKRAEQTLRESGEQLRALLTRLQQAQEAERIRVAREIHDELGQLLTGLKMDVRWLERKLADPGLPPALLPLLDRAVAASELADQTIAVVQKIAAELRPGALDRLGLGAALTQSARRFQARTGILCHVLGAESGAALPAAHVTELYYICVEALTNVARHANATEVQIRFEISAAGTLLEVSDNGVGIPEGGFNAPQSLGLLGMRERAAQCGGTIVWERCQPQGTRVAVHVPAGGAKLNPGVSS